MKKFGIQDHEVYKKRGRMNIQIGLLLGAFVVLVMVATIAKLSNNNAAKMAENTSVEQTQ